MKKVKQFFSNKKESLKKFAIDKFINSKFATIKNLAKINKEELWKLYLLNNFTQEFLVNPNIIQWLPTYLCNHSKYVYGKESKVDKSLRTLSFTQLFHLVFKCEALNMLPIMLIKGQSGMISYMDVLSQNEICVKLFTKLTHLNPYVISASYDKTIEEHFKNIYGLNIEKHTWEAIDTEAIGYLNNLVVDKLMKLGVSNAVEQFKKQNINYNICFDKENKDLKDFGITEFVDKNGDDQINVFTNVKAYYDEQHKDRINVAIEKVISSQILKVSNLINVVNRTNKADTIIINSQIASYLCDCGGFVMSSTDTFSLQDNPSLKYFGDFCGMRVYVNPDMKWNDNRICVGISGRNNTTIPGTKIIINKLMADSFVLKMNDKTKLENSVNLALEDLSNIPELNWFTFAISINDNLF